MSQDDNSALATWKLSVKPPPLVCPRTFCWFFRRAGSRVAPGQYPNIDAALADALPIPEDPCGCSLGVCTRLDPLHGDHDWYEPHEVELERAGLPWFFFIPSAQKVAEDMREEYVRASRKLWGDSSAES